MRCTVARQALHCTRDGSAWSPGSESSSSEAVARSRDSCSDSSRCEQGRDVQHSAAERVAYSLHRRRAAPAAGQRPTFKHNDVYCH